MKKLVERFAAALAALRASVSHAVLVSVQAADGALTWVWRTITGPGVTAPVEYVPDVPTGPEPVEDVELASMCDIGQQAVVAAQALVAGQGVPAGTDPILRRWLESLEKSDLMRVAEAEPLDAGRHIAGRDVLRSVEGLSIRRPEPEGDLDRERLRKRRREQDLADRERALSAAARRERVEKVEWEAALVASPSFSPAGW